MKITATDATTLTLTVGAGGAVVLGLDGDGSVGRRSRPPGTKLR
jgi:hypothetical protein